MGRRRNRATSGRSGAALHGVIVLDKPTGMTSAAVVARVKRTLGVKRVGHTGTLDPMATGVLPLCLGQGTKIAGYLLAEDKTYAAEMALGVTTDTLDADGTVTEQRPEAAAAVTEALVRAAMGAFQGPGMQVPPMYSALKHKGKRLHELARAGQTVDRPPRPIHIYKLQLLAFGTDAHGRPSVRFEVHCSKGTYVRTLAADLGDRLGCGAHLTALRRVQSGAFTLEHALQVDEITEDKARERIVSAAAALAHLSALEVPSDLCGKVENGLPMAWPRLAGSRSQPAPDEVVRLLTPAGELLALIAVDERGQINYRRVFRPVAAGIGLPT